MEEPPRIVLIHATPVAIEPIHRAAAEGWPEAEMIDLLESALSVDRARQKTLTAPLDARIGALADYATGIGARGVLFTCSAFGAAIEAAAARAPIPILKPNEAMFDAAFAEGERIALVCTFAPAVGGMIAEFEAEAARRGAAAVLTTHLCESALSALQAGDAAEHDRRIAATVAGITGADAILLAQFSMARAAPLCRAATRIPVLTSPDAAIARLRAAVAGEVPAC